MTVWKDVVLQLGTSVKKYASYQSFVERLDDRLNDPTVNTLIGLLPALNAGNLRAAVDMQEEIVRLIGTAAATIARGSIVVSYVNAPPGNLTTGQVARFEFRIRSFTTQADSFTVRVLPNAGWPRVLVDNLGNPVPNNKVPVGPAGTQSTIFINVTPQTGTSGLQLNVVSDSNPAEIDQFTGLLTLDPGAARTSRRRRDPVQPRDPVPRGAELCDRCRDRGGIPAGRLDRRAHLQFHGSGGDVYARSGNRPWHRRTRLDLDDRAPRRPDRNNPPRRARETGRHQHYRRPWRAVGAGSLHGVDDHCRRSCHRPDRRSDCHWRHLTAEVQATDARRDVMKRVASLVKGFALAAVTGTIIYAECLPLVNGTFNTNGIVVGSVVGGGGTPPGGCGADAGWGGVTENAFAPVNGGPPDTHRSRMFFVATPSGPNIDRMFVGIHVENDDGFTANDILTMFVDANNSGAFDAADFALRIEMGPNAPPANEDCDKAANNVTFYRFSGGNWNVTPLPSPTAVTVKTSFDYNADMPDPESGIWEVEIEIRPAALGAAMPIATGARIGAKLYVEEPGVGVRVLAFPAGLTTNDDPNATSPNDGGVTAANLATLTVGTCGFDVVIESISSADHLGNPGRITRNYPNPIVGTVEDNRRSKFNAQVRFKNPANAADTSPVAVPNSGTVTFRAMPWNAGNFTGDFLIGNPNVQFTALGQVKTVQITWPANEAQYADRPVRPSI